MDVEWPERDAREWLLGPRGAEREPWEEAAANLPGAADAVAALLCVAQSAPTIWMREEVEDDLDVWGTLQQLVTAYDAGDRDAGTWTEVLGGQAHVALLASS